MKIYFKPVKTSAQPSFLPTVVPGVLSAAVGVNVASAVSTTAEGVLTAVSAVSIGVPNEASSSTSITSSPETSGGSMPFNVGEGVIFIFAVLDADGDTLALGLADWLADGFVVAVLAAVVAAGADVF